MFKFSVKKLKINAYAIYNNNYYNNIKKSRNNKYKRLKKIKIKLKVVYFKQNFQNKKD